MILALETSSKVSSVAVADENRIVSEISVQTRFTHSETLLENIQTALKIAETDFENISAVAVGIGPGSFTGLRIGLATAKSLSYAWKIPIIGVPTSEALACHFAHSNSEIWQLIDAQKNSAYLSKFDCSDNIPKQIDDIKILPIPEILSRAENSQRRIIFQGDIVDKKFAGKTESKIELPTNVSLAPIHMRLPRASNVAIAGINRLEKNLIDNVMNLEPMYLRRSEAEILFDRRQA